MGFGVFLGGCAAEMEARGILFLFFYGVASDMTLIAFSKQTQSPTPRLQQPIS